MSAGRYEYTSNPTMVQTVDNSSAPVEYGGSTMIVNRLASFTVPGVSGAVSLSAVWHFNGSYSGVPIGDIRANGIANV